ncbi:two-component regulator propeller domain-containing protein [Candidatus Riflebacteria bacterium]
MFRIITLSLFIFIFISGCGKKKTGKIQAKNILPKISIWRTQDGLSSNKINCIARFDGKIWVGTDRGLNIIDKNGKVEVISKRNKRGLPSDKINKFLIDVKSLLIATENGLLIVKNKKWFPAGGRPIKDLYSFAGKIYCGTASGVSIYNFSSWSHNTLERFKFPHRSVQTISGDGQGYFFLGFPNGFAITDLKSEGRIFQGRQMRISLDGIWSYLPARPASCNLLDNNIGDIFYLNKEIWLAHKIGLSIFNLNFWKNFTGDRVEEVIISGKLKRVQKPGNSGLLGSKIRDLVLHNKKIFIGSDKGLSILDPEKNSWSHPLKETSFFTSGVTAIFVDEKFIYAGLSHKGLIQITRQVKKN